jgi:hypothetical protein
VEPGEPHDGVVDVAAGVVDREVERDVAGGERQPGVAERAAAHLGAQGDGGEVVRTVGAAYAAAHQHAAGRLQLGRVARVQRRDEGEQRSEVGARRREGEVERRRPFAELHGAGECEREVVEAEPVVAEREPLRARVDGHVGVERERDPVQVRHAADAQRRLARAHPGGDVHAVPREVAAERHVEPRGARDDVGVPVVEQHAGVAHGQLAERDRDRAPVPRRAPGVRRAMSQLAAPSASTRNLATGRRTSTSRTTTASPRRTWRSTLPRSTTARTRSAARSVSPAKRWTPTIDTPSSRTLRFGKSRSSPTRTPRQRTSALTASVTAARARAATRSANKSGTTASVKSGAATRQRGRRRACGGRGAWGAGR